MHALRPLSLLLLMLALLSAPSTALAHKVNIFAYVDGHNIVADCFFSKTSKVINGTVSVIDVQTGAVLATGTTDDKGALSIPVPQQAIASGHDLKLLLKAGEGHQNDTTISASEFAGLKAQASAKTASAAVKPTEAKPAAKPVAAQEKAKTQAAAASAAPAAAVAAGTVMDEATLTRIVTQAVDQAVEGRMAPVKRMLLESTEKGPSMTEIIGGIGYIFGLFGITAFVASRRKERLSK